MFSAYQSGPVGELAMNSLELYFMLFPCWSLAYQQFVDNVYEFLEYEVDEEKDISSKAMTD